MGARGIVCGDDSKNCVACEGNNRPPVKMRECPLCDGTGSIGLFAGLFQALDRAKSGEDGGEE